MNRNVIITLVIYVAVSIGVAGWVFKTAFETQLAQDRATGEARLSDSISRLKGQLDYYRALINFISQDQEVAASLTDLSHVGIADKLSGIALTYGATSIDMIDVDGIVTASSTPDNIGAKYSATIVQPALNGRLGRENVLQGNERSIRLSRNIGGSIPMRDRAVVMTINLAALEFEWPVSPEPIFFIDEFGQVLAANRTALLSLGNVNGPTLTQNMKGTSFFNSNSYLWQYASSQLSEVQVLSRPIPQLELDANILLETDSARQSAYLRSSLVLASSIVLGLIGTILFQQRRRLALESQHTATLEARVAERTLELHAAQDELVEASNLAALGRLSAGLSHELNQPLAAILNFSENAKAFLKRGKEDKAQENLKFIGDQVRRMTRIIGNLRAFARQEATPMERVELTAAIKSAVKIAQHDLDTNQVKLKLVVPDAQIFVLAGRVRLEQVLLNLISNAIDAMSNSNAKNLRIVLCEELNIAELAVTDNGLGVQAPDLVFEPFYTTKELGSSKGLGMGLALAFGIIQSFNGQITCKNNQDAGATFMIKLPTDTDK